MWRRCTNEKDAAYPHYGGRGITVCARWESYAAFEADMGRRPESMSIDRIDNNGNYEPGNCRWATQKQQARNTRTNVVYFHDGEWRCIAEIAERTGVDRSLLAHRLASDWTLDRAINTDPNAANDPYTPVQVAIRNLRAHKQALLNTGRTADQIANRAFDPAANEPRFADAVLA